jgi:hypothetical protein
MSTRMSGRRFVSAALGAGTLAGAMLLGPVAAYADDGATAEVTSPEPTATAQVDPPADPAPPADNGSGGSTGSHDNGSSTGGTHTSKSTLPPASSTTAVAPAPAAAKAATPAATATPSPADAKAKKKAKADPKPGEPCPKPPPQLNDNRDRGFFTISAANGPTLTQKVVTLTFRCFGAEFGDVKGTVTHVSMVFTGRKAGGSGVALPILQGDPTFSFKGKASSSEIDHVATFLLDLSGLGTPVNDCFLVNALANTRPDHSSTRGANFAINRHTGSPTGCAAPKPTVSPLVVTPRHHTPFKVLPFTGSGALINYVAIAVWLLVVGFLLSTLPRRLRPLYARRH